MSARALALAAAVLCAPGVQAQCVAPLQAAAETACWAALDVVFVLDSSGSIGSWQFSSARQFINDTLAAFDFDDERVRRAGPHRPSVRTWHRALRL